MSFVPSNRKGDPEKTALAVNPQPGTRIWRVSRPGTETESHGIHWTTDKSVTGSFPRGDVHEAVIDDPQAQVIPHSALSRIQFNKEGQIEIPSDSRAMGWQWEAELRLRPGANIRMASGETKPVEHKGGQFYVGLGEHSVRGSAEALRHMTNEAHLGHTQHSMLQTVTARDDPTKVLGYHTSLEGNAGGYEGWAEDLHDTQDRIAAEHGLEWHEVQSHELTVKTPPKGPLREDQFGFGRF